MTAQRDVMHPYLRKIDTAYSERLLDDIMLEKPETRRHHAAFGVAIQLFPASELAWQENARILTYLILVLIL